MESPRHFLDLDGMETSDLQDIISLGAAYKRGETPSGKERPLAGKTLALIFEKPSTRTRVSFEVGMKQLGGDVTVLGHTDTQLGRGETIADTARVLSRYVDAIMIRTDSHEKLLDLAGHASVPVINGLTDQSHPCQLMADLMTFEEHRGPVAGKIFAWVGDGNNVAVSWIHAAVKFSFTLRLACPESLTPPQQVLDWAGTQGVAVSLVHDAAVAVEGADCIITDTWVSMGGKNEQARRTVLAPFQVSESLMNRAGGKALFMHCLPAHRGEEVTDAVIDGPWSVVWDESENRLHAQKGILSWCLQ
jgi:ornithine carbamoyltransferase